MDNIDRKILAFVQADFPLVERPYAVIGEKVGCSEEEAFRRVMEMKEAGLIRRIGGSFDSRKLGYVTTLVAMRVPENELERVAGLVNRYPQVTHNYERDGARFNLWFTVVAESREKLVKILAEIRAEAPGAEMLELPARRLFKLEVRFDPIREEEQP
jgi:DNA-binding Lrp family transcriptional regulator